MSSRGKAEEAIRRWTSDLHYDQKDLASQVCVSCSAISHIVNDPEYAISENLARRIVAAVDREAGTRIAALPMEILAFCHDPDFVPDEGAKKMIVTQIKSALAANALREVAVGATQLVLPDGVRAVLVRVGGPNSALFLIALNAKNSDDEKRALAHELEHLKEIVLRGVAKYKSTPRSSY